MKKKKSKPLAINNPGDEILKKMDPAQQIISSTPSMKECDCVIKDVLAYVGGFALGLAIGYGLYLGVTYILSPSYSEGKCFSQSEYSNSITAKILSNDRGIYYQYADTRDLKTDTKHRQTADFKETYPVQIDCEKFFNNREEIRHDNDLNNYLEHLRSLRKQLDEEKAKNANRTRKG